MKGVFLKNSETFVGLRCPLIAIIEIDINVGSQIDVVEIIMISEKNITIEVKRIGQVVLILNVNVRYEGLTERDIVFLKERLSLKKVDFIQDAV